MSKQALIESMILDMIRHGVLKPGDQLPSVRKLAAQQKMSITPVMEAYYSLELQEMVECRVRSGYYLTDKALEYASPSMLSQRLFEKDVYPAGETKSQHSLWLKFSDAALMTTPHRYPFSTMTTPPTMFPNEALSAHISRTARLVPEGVGQFYVRHDSELLQAAIARQMFHSQCIVGRNEICIISGLMQAKILALRACTNTGDLVAMESPGNEVTIMALRFLGLRAVPVPSDPVTGMDPAALEHALEENPGVRCVALSPTNSEPCGSTMPQSAKEALVAVAQKHCIAIIEDDAMGDTCFGVSRQPALKSIAPDDVIYISGFEKTFAPGLHIAWIAGGLYSADILFYKGLSMPLVPTLIQDSVAAFLDTSAAKAQLKKVRSAYKSGVTNFYHAIGRYFPAETKTHLPSGGHFLWVQLPVAVDVERYFDLLMEQSISIAPGPVFSMGHEFTHCFRINCCSVPWNEETESVLARMGRLAQDLSVP